MTSPSFRFEMEVKVERSFVLFDTSSSFVVCAVVVDAISPLAVATISIAESGWNTTLGGSNDLAQKKEAVK